MDEPPTCGLGRTVDAATIRALIVFFAVTPLVAVALQHPETGVISDSLAASEWPAQAFCSVGFILSALVEALGLGNPYGLASAPVFTSVIWTTWRQPTLATTTDCSMYCLVHLFAVALLMVVVLIGLYVRGVRLAVVGLVGAAMAFITIGYNVVVNDDAFDATNPEYRQWLALIGAFELGLVLFERSVAATVPPRGVASESVRCNFA